MSTEAFDLAHAGLRPLDAFPKPWRFHYDEVPRVIAANGNVVAVIATGTLQEAHRLSDIIDVGEMIAALGR